MPEFLNVKVGIFSLLFKFFFKNRLILKLLYIFYSHRHMQFFLHEPKFHNTRIKLLSWAAEVFCKIGQKLVASVGNYLAICGIMRQPLTMQVWGPGRDHLVEPAADSPAGDDSGGTQHSQVCFALYNNSHLWTVNSRSNGWWFKVDCLSLMVDGSFLIISSVLSAAGRCAITRSTYQ